MSNNEITDAQIDALKERIEHEKSLPEDDKEAFFTWFRLYYGGDVNTDFYTAWKAGKADSDKRRKAEAKPELPADEREKFEAWFINFIGGRIGDLLMKNDDNDYIENFVDWAWKGFQAAKADAAEQIEENWQAYKSADAKVIELEEKLENEETAHHQTKVEYACLFHEHKAAAVRTRAQVERAVRLAVKEISETIEDGQEIINEDVFIQYLLRERAEQPTTEQDDANIDNNAVDAFAQKMKAKLAKKRGEGYAGWQDKDICNEERLSKMLRDHVEKGDPVDVANFAMMLSQRGERIVQPAPVAQQELTDWKIVAQVGNPPEGLYIAIYDGGGVMPVALIAYGKYEYAADYNAAEADDDDYIRGFGWHEEIEDVNGDDYTHIPNVIAYLPTNYDMKSLKSARALLAAQQPQASVSAQSDKEPM